MQGKLGLFAVLGRARKCFYKRFVSVEVMVTDFDLLQLVGAESGHSRSHVNRPASARSGQELLDWVRGRGPHILTLILHDGNLSLKDSILHGGKVNLQSTKTLRGEFDDAVPNDCRAFIKVCLEG